MNFISIIIAIFIIPYCSSSTGKSDNNVLLHVHTIFRHGDRAPVKVINPNKIGFWPNGIGELTDVGIKQHFQLGQWIRQRYNGFLSTKFNHKEIYVRSTDVNRTLMSVQSNLAGMYYNEQNMIIPNLIWRPIAVHTIPEKSDIVMLPDVCDKYVTKRAKMFTSDTFTPILKEHQYTLDSLRKIFNKPKLQFKDIWSIHDTLFCEKAHNITWDSWATDELYKNLTKFNHVNWQIMFHGEQLQKLSGGLFLNEIIIKLNEIASKPMKEIKEKLRIYSAHDIDIAALMSAIGVYNQRQPPYASCFIIELWKDTLKNNVFIKMYFKDDVNQKSTHLPELTFKQCKQNPCTLQKFIEVVRPTTLTLSQYNRECFITRHKFLIWQLGIIFAIVVTLLMVYIIYLQIKTCRKNKDDNVCCWI